MWLQAAHTDYADPSVPDYSFATFGVSPDTVVDFASFQRRLGIRLQPRWSAFAGVAQPRVVLGDFQYPAQPRRYGWLQHYVLQAEPAVPDVEMTARHFYGSDYPQQMLDVTCRTNLMAGRIAETGR